VPTDAVAQTVNHRLPIFSATGPPVTHHRSERTTAHLPRVKGLFGSHSSLFLRCFLCRTRSYMITTVVTNSVRASGSRPSSGKCARNIAPRSLPNDDTPLRPHRRRAGSGPVLLWSLCRGPALRRSLPVWLGAPPPVWRLSTPYSLPAAQVPRPRSWQCPQRTRGEPLTCGGNQADGVALAKCR
jgi:hypothetical protein